MLKNYLKIAIRNILRNKLYSFINIGGLAVGMAACLLIFLYVENDFSFDKFNANYNRIYRVVVEPKHNNGNSNWPLTPSGYAPAFVNDFPSVQAIRITPPSFYTPVIRYHEKFFTGKDFLFADSTFFDIFTFPLIDGNPRTALSQPFSLVISQSEARQIFGRADPIGKVIKVNNLFDFRVTGVARDCPHNSTIQFNYLASFANISDLYTTQYHLKMFRQVLDNFNSSNFFTFLLLPKGLTIGSVQKQMPAFLDKYLGDQAGAQTKVLFQPLSNVHFNTNLQYDFPNKGDIRYDYMLSAIAFFILLIACVNFINISTARSASRGKEIGVRKVLGANRLGLAQQFMAELLLMTLVSAVIAFGILELFLPIFDSMAKAHLSANLLDNPGTVVSFAFVWFLVIILACVYPSAYLASFEPSSIMKGVFRRRTGGSGLRKSLIIFQFAVSVLLIVATVVVWRQYNFLVLHTLGFNDRQVLFAPPNSEITGHYDAFKAQLLQRSDIRYVSRANWVPGNAGDEETFYWRGKSGWHPLASYSLIVDPDFVKALGLRLMAGRDFSWARPSDWADGYILNERAAQMIGWSPDSAINQRLTAWYHKGRVIGVVKDFNFRSLRRGIEPVVMVMDSSLRSAQGVVVKMSSKDIPTTLSYVERTWKQFSPDFPLDYHFVDQSFYQLYRSEERLSGTFLAFSTLAILIACLGLFGLAAYATERRTKEMGIRKALGASVPQVVRLVTGDFIKLVIIANVIAWPLAYYAMERWLQTFAYRIDVGLWSLMLSGGLAVMIAMATVSAQAVKAATANPVESLRYE